MLIPILVFAVLAIVLIFSLIKSSETWNWIPITFVALIFLVSIFAGISASRSLKTRAAWKARFLENERLLENARVEYEQNLFGDPNSVDGFGEGSLRDINNKLVLNQIGKGRIWDAGVPVLQGDEKFTLTFGPVAGQVSPTDQIQQDMQLFAFSLGGLDGVSVPANYVGSFKVNSVDQAGNAVTLEPVFLNQYLRTGSLMRMLSAELANGDNTDKINRLAVELEMELSDDLEVEFQNGWQQVAEGGDASSLVSWLDDKQAGFSPSIAESWSLFEKMPGDSRDAFKIHLGMPEFDDDNNEATPEKMAAYRAALESTYLPAAMMGMEPDSREYEELLDEYTFDGVPLNVINLYITENVASRFNDSFDPNDENRKGKLRFDATSEPFSVDSPGGNLATDGTFNASGEANDPALLQGNQPTFAKDDEIIVDKISAIQGSDTRPPLVDSNVATWLEVEYFVRPLRDYPFQLSEFRELTRNVTEHRRAIDADLEVTQTMIEFGNQQLAHRQQMKTKLDEDIATMQRDLDEITRLAELREAELNQSTQQIRTYYNQIIELYKLSQNTGESLDSDITKPPSSLAKHSR